MTATGSVTLIGSGEFLDAMAKVHRRLLRPLGAGVTAVFLDTPAGFELNLDTLSERAVQYFAQRFEVGLGVVCYRSRSAAAAEVGTALHLLSGANYIVAGPGSPSYAVRTWAGSAVWEAVLERLASGACVVLASAAAIAAGRTALPVYEIYRGGVDPHWIEGLDLLGPYGLKLAVIPHWNNTDGAGYDTRFCFLGEDRLNALRRTLAPGVAVLGIDEHTACTFDLATRRCLVAGVGSVTVIRGEEWVVHEAGSEFPFEELMVTETQVPAGGELSPSSGSGQTITTRLLRELAAALEDAPDPDIHGELVAVAHSTIHELEAGEGERRADSSTLEATIDLLQRARLELRARKSFELADEIRDRLAEMGIASSDRAIG